eukprot:COSAG01_NODE_1954_length_8817_cov_18.303166_1_plen_110_part_00
MTVWPAQLSWSAAAMPAGPEPPMAIFLPVRVAGGTGHHPALLEAAVDDGALDGLDRHGLLDDAQHAGALARCRAHAPGNARTHAPIVVQHLVTAVPTAEARAPAGGGGW